VIISDILLPDIFGMELLSIYTKSSIPIIVMSSMDEEDAKYFAETINAFGYLNKPFNCDILLKLLS